MIAREFFHPEGNVVVSGAAWRCFLIILGIYSLLSCPQTGWADSEYQLILKDSLLQTDVQASDRGGCILVPLRFVAEALGAKVAFDNISKTTTLEMGSRSIQIPIGSFTYYDSGLSYRLEYPACIINERTMVPTTFIDDTWGTRTYLDGRSGQVIIN